MRWRGNNLRVGSSALMGRRFLPLLTAVPVVMGEEPWRERPRLRAMNLAPRAFEGRSRHGSRWPSRCHCGGPLPCPFECSKRRADRGQDREQDRWLPGGQNAGVHGGRHAVQGVDERRT